VGVPTIFRNELSGINAAKKDSLGGYADDLGLPTRRCRAPCNTPTRPSASSCRIGAEQPDQHDRDHLMAKHGESSLDPSLRVVVNTSAIQGILTLAGFPASGIPRLLRKTAALICSRISRRPRRSPAFSTQKANEQSLHLAADSHAGFSEAAVPRSAGGSGSSDGS